MKDKIFNALKQEYSRLGLGDNILSGLAQMLATTGMVTDENLQGVIASQKDYLEGLQKSNDKRVNDALTAKQKEIDELKAKVNQPTPPAPPAPQDMPDWYKREREARKAEIDALAAEMKALRDSKEDAAKRVAALEEEKKAELARRAAAERKSQIGNRAKEKGIPEWLIKHGFPDIPENATDEQVNAILDTYAKEVQTQFLPSRGGVVMTGNITKADTDAMVAQLFPSAKK